MRSLHFFSALIPILFLSASGCITEVVNPATKTDGEKTQEKTDDKSDGETEDKTGGESGNEGDTGKEEQPSHGDFYQMGIDRVEAHPQGLATLVAYVVNRDAAAPADTGAVALRVEIGPSPDTAAMYAPEAVGAACQLEFTDENIIVRLAGLDAGRHYARLVVQSQQHGTQGSAAYEINIPQWAGTPSAPEPVAVDLGLSVLWAATDIGASASACQDPAAFGFFYPWGVCGAQPASFVEKDNYLAPYAPLMPACVSGMPQMDVAAAILGNGWRLPTHAEALELFDIFNAKMRPETINGACVVGVTSKKEGYADAKIYFPLCGYKDDGQKGGGQKDGVREQGTPPTDAGRAGWFLTADRGVIMKIYLDGDNLLRSVAQNSAVWAGCCVRPVKDKR